jgi:glycosyltransferase involved in cell wall biosynthesis
MGDPLVSIITPVLNQVETMGVCLGSETRQTFRSIDHIVVVGGSTDGTWPWLLRWRRDQLSEQPKAQECKMSSIGCGDR